MNVIRLSHVYFKYPHSQVVLQDVSLSITDDMFPLAIVGANGSGKTTLLKNIVGLLKPIKGDIEVYGKNIHTLVARKRAELVGAVFSDKAYPADLPVIDVVLSGIYRNNRPWGGYSRSDVEAAEDVLRTLDIIHLRDRLFSELSSGERQLVLLAMVIMQSPSVILLDEPTSFLDPYHRYVLSDIVITVLQKHKIIFTSHDIEFIRAVARFAVGIKDGKITYIGQTEEFFQVGFEKVFGISFEKYRGVFGL